MRWILPLLLTVASCSAALVAQPSRVDFNRDVRPIISDNCFACHGPDEKARKAELRLDTPEGLLKVVKAGKPAESDLLKRIISTDSTERMPPPKTGKTLSAGQIETLKRWITDGAEFRGHWAFTAPKRAELPKLSAEGEKWVRTPVDRFIWERFRQEKLAPTAEADRATLIRRLSLDLTGLPPTLEEIRQFTADQSPDAYEKAVKRLTGSIRYGERMALDWLDAARYADTNGYHIDNGRDMTRWREWVINAFHTNMPYDRFTREQLAGDLIPGATLSQKVASGFNRNHMINFEGGAIPDEYHTAYIVDRVNTTATVWMGLTLACAQCHDHKYDPFSQKDYYQLYAFFNNVPERGLDGNRGNSVPMIKVPSSEQEKRMQSHRDALANLEKQAAGPMPEVDAAQAEWEKNPGQAVTEWRIVPPTKTRSRGGATFRVEKDGTVIVEGPVAPTEQYTVTFRSDVDNLTAVRIDALPDDRYPGKGPGRSNNGNFVMTGLRLLPGDGVKGSQALKLKTASADYSQKDGNFDVKSLLSKGPGWAIYPQVGQAHHAVFEVADPIKSVGKEFTIVMQFNSQFPGHQLARFRLAVTNSASPHVPAGRPADIDAILAKKAAERSEEQKARLRKFYRDAVSPVTRKLAAEIGSHRSALAEIEKAIPDAMVMEEMPKPRDTFVLTRGEYDKKGQKVTAGLPAALPPLPKGAPMNRLGLADWLLDPSHPLTARVTVNRYWQMFFGTGLVKTSEDFGTQGEFPSHPELLDWLAVDFRESGWDVRRLVTMIVTSSAYRQASVVTKESVARDPENRLIARGSRFRLQAEMIRDQALAVSGLLNGEVGGKSVSPYQPPGLWEELMSRADGDNWTAQKYRQSSGAELYRRTMYTFWKRTCPPAQLAALDAPDRETCVVRRSRTNTPLQALILMNDPTYVEAARKFAERIIKEGGKSMDDRITFAFQSATARVPSDRERAVLRKAFETHLQKFTNDAAAVAKLLKVGESAVDGALNGAEIAAWAMIANAILNLDEVLSRG